MLCHHSDGSGEFVAGKLFGTEAQKRYYSQTLDAGPMVSRWSRTGYELPFASIPPNPLSAPNNKSLYDNLTFARAEVGRQVKMGILSEVSWRPFIVNPISVDFTNKWRLVVDCRLLNPFLVKRKVKLEDLKVIPDLVSRGDFMSTDDLEKGYWQVPLNRQYRKYIGIMLDGKFYVANVLILGISDAVYAFTKINRPIIRYLRSRGVKAAVYIDDWFTCQQPLDLAIRNRTFLMSVLTNCGWILSSPKHHPMALQKIFLGLTVNSVSMEFEIPAFFCLLAISKQKPNEFQISWKM